VFEPTGFVSPLRVMVREVDQATLFVPDVFAFKAKAIALAQRVNPRRDVNVVSNKDRLTRSEADNESLVLSSAAVVRQYPSDHALAFDLYIAGPVLEGAPDRIVINRRSPIAGLKRAAASGE